MTLLQMPGADNEAAPAISLLSADACQLIQQHAAAPSAAIAGAAAAVYYTPSAGKESGMIQPACLSMFASMLLPPHWWQSALTTPTLRPG